MSESGSLQPRLSSNIDSTKHIQVSLTTKLIFSRAVRGDMRDLTPPEVEMPRETLPFNGKSCADSDGSDNLADDHPTHAGEDRVVADVSSAELKLLYRQLFALGLPMFLLRNRNFYIANCLL
jgi:hypothetical protein